MPRAASVVVAWALRVASAFAFASRAASMVSAIPRGPPRQVAHS